MIFCLSPRFLRGGPIHRPFRTNSCSIGHPPLSSASPVNLRLRVGPRALSGKKKELREQGVNKFLVLLTTHGGSSHFFGIGIYPVSDWLGIGIFGQYCSPLFRIVPPFFPRKGGCPHQKGGHCPPFKEKRGQLPPF